MKEKVNRNEKDRLFCFIFGREENKKWILELYNAVNGTAHDNPNDVDVRVHMYNIRPQFKSGLLTECKPLSEYSWFIEEVRTNLETMEMELAVDKAIEKMPDNFEIKEFIVEHQSEVKNMCITEYNEAETMELFKRDAREEGLEEGGDLRDTMRITDMLRRGKTVEEIVDFCNYPYEQVKKVEDSLLTEA